MARNAGVAVENSFVNGLVTEATGLNFPENAVTDTNNCVFDPVGKVTRRPGIDWEVGFEIFKNTGTAEVATVEYLWENVGGDGLYNALVQQIGNIIYVFQIIPGQPVSDNPVYSLDLLNFDTEASLVPISPCDFATGLGRLIVTHKACDPFYIEYNRNTQVFSAATINIRTRDFRGLDPRPTGRGATLTPPEYYNRINQGWSDQLLNEYLSKLTFFPSDFEVWWLYKGPEPIFDGAEIFLPVPIVNQVSANYINRGNSPAPNGSVILNEFLQDRSAATGVADLPVISSQFYRPSTCAFHAGRVFYSGVDWQEYSSKVYFTQIIERPVQFGMCYQENDPASQFSPDLLPTDGGVISIPEAGTIIKLWSISNSVIVVASNGVWEITGSSGIGFAATDYTAKKISSIQTASRLSFVNVLGSPLWWGVEGIYIASASETGVGVSVQNISDAKIRRHFLDIPEDARKYAKGVYNPKDQTVTWIHRNTVGDTVQAKYLYNRALVFNVSSKAFYPWSFANPTYFVKGIFTFKWGNIVDDVDVVRFLCHTSGNQWTYGKLYDTVRDDWHGRDGGPYPFDSHFTTGFKLRGQGMSKAQSNYLRLYNEGPGTLMLHAKWDYRLDASSGKWSNPQIITFDNLEQTHTQTRRVKVRGHGLALQLHVQSVGVQDFDLVGWTSFDTVNARP